MRDKLILRLKSIDITILFVTLALSAFGLLMISSATQSGIRGVSSEYFINRQIMWMIAGFIVFFVLSFFDFKKVEGYALFFYVVTIIMLIAVFFVGKTKLGAQRWIEFGPANIQPSEFAKLFVIFFLSSFLSRIKDRAPALNEITQSLVIVGIPVVLIFLQPDLGTTVVLLVGWFAAVFASGASLRDMLIFVLAFILVFVLALKFGILHDYQIKRLTSFLNPEADMSGSGYNIVQAKIAIGSGGLKGKGIYSGTQSLLRFIPERHADFIFSVIGEETGFAGSVFLVILYFILVFRLIMIARAIKDRMSSIFIFSYTAMFVFHVFVNIGMNVGIMPVTGIPLPFVSYGGSFFLINMITLGIIQSLWSSRFASRK